MRPCCLLCCDITVENICTWTLNSSAFWWFGLLPFYCCFDIVIIKHIILAASSHWPISPSHYSALFAFLFLYVEVIQCSNNSLANRVNNCIPVLSSSLVTITMIHPAWAQQENCHATLEAFLWPELNLCCSWTLLSNRFKDVDVLLYHGCAWVWSKVD